MATKNISYLKKNDTWVGGTVISFVFICIRRSLPMKQLLYRYIRKQTSHEEDKQVLRWLRENPDNLAQFSALKAELVAEELRQGQDGVVAGVYDKFKRKQLAKKRVQLAKYAAAASVVVLFGLLLHLYQPGKLGDKGGPSNSEMMLVHNKGKEQKEVVLPDGSTVLLNMDSQIEYPAIFKGAKRSVSFIGEGYFNITHDSIKPFVVSTQDFDIKVLGTTFNVKSYLNDTQTETTLISGKVEVLREAEEPLLLAPSQKAIFSKENKKMDVEKVVLEDAVAWQKGSLIFKSTPMEQVVLDLERKYDVKIKINSPKLLKYEYTGTFDNLTMKEALQLLVMSSPIQYKEVNQKIILDYKEKK